jgi:hypothetical protein
VIPSRCPEGDLPAWDTRFRHLAYVRAAVSSKSGPAQSVRSHPARVRRLVKANRGEGPVMTCTPADRDAIGLLVIGSRKLIRLRLSLTAHAFHASPAIWVPSGRPVGGRRRLSEPVTVRLTEILLAEIDDRATADDGSVSTWIRGAVEHELRRNGS